MRTFMWAKSYEGESYENKMLPGKLLYMGNEFNRGMRTKGEWVIGSTKCHKNDQKVRDSTLYV